MKLFLMLSATCAFILCTAGCGTSGAVRKSTQSATVNLAMSGEPQGYVEFYAREQNNAVPIFRRDDKQRLQLVGVIGLKAGSRYRAAIGEPDAPVSETLRVAVSPGTHTFTIQRDGETLSVSVAQDRVIPVEVNYVVLDRGALNEVYRVTAYVLGPVAPSEARRGLAQH